MMAECGSAGVVSVVRWIEWSAQSRDRVAVVWVVRIQGACLWTS